MYAIRSYYVRRSAFVALGALSGAITLLILALVEMVAPHHSAREISRAIVARAGPEDAIVVEGSLEYSPALPFYTGRRVLLVNGALGRNNFV